MQTQATIIIDRPVQDLWDYLDDHRNDRVWRRPQLQKLEQGRRPQPQPTRQPTDDEAPGP